MKTEIIQLVLALLSLIFGGALEEMLPKFSGVGFPFLLMASIFWASKRSLTAMIMFSIAAGSFEDALSNLPFATSLAYFTLIAAFTRTTELKYSAFAFSYPIYQIWLWMWLPGLSGGVFTRFLVSIPVGLVCAWASSMILEWLDRKGAVGEE
ncbi:MAG: hypothetical protein IJQ34_05360 [Kiritimatiellae bacterium]|nr:hypothetical protein [Kiritimatiellia bacterium]